MSNPAVIKLYEKKQYRSIPRRIVIEDNIGESIHIHIDNLRIDMRIDEFMIFSDTIRRAIDELKIFQDYKIDNFDEYFLSQISPHIKDITSITVENVNISELKVIDRYTIFKTLNLTRVVPLSQSSAYKYLKNKSDKFKNYQQFNYGNESNLSRLRKLKDSVEDQYPKSEQYIILFNNKNIIMDGQHRASILLNSLGENSTIPIMRFNFKNNKMRQYTWRSNLKAISIWLIKTVYRRYIRK